MLRLIVDNSPKPIPVQPRYIAHCKQPGCQHVERAKSDGKAIRQLAHHIVTAHMPPPFTRGDEAS